MKINKIKREDGGKYQCLHEGQTTRQNLTLNVVSGDYETQPAGGLEALSHKKDADTDAMENEPDTTQLKQTYARISKLVGDRVTLVCPLLGLGKCCSYFNQGTFIWSLGYLL